MQGRSKSFYEAWGNSLKQHLTNCFPNTRFRIVGSRENDSFKRTSDLDFQICFEGGTTTKESIYSSMVECLNGRMKGKTILNERVREVSIGGSGNVVNVYPERGGKISFALEPCSKF